MMVFLDVDFWIVMLTVSRLNKKYKLQISKRDLKLNSKGSKSCNLSETASSLWKVDHKASWKQRVRLNVQSETSASTQKWSNALKKYPKISGDIVSIWQCLFIQWDKVRRIKYKSSNSRWWYITAITCKWLQETLYSKRVKEQLSLWKTKCQITKQNKKWP